MKSKGIWSKRSKKHVILISQTAHTNPWIYRDPKLIMILATWLAGGLTRQRATHSLSLWTGRRRTTCRMTSKMANMFQLPSFLFFFSPPPSSWHERTLSGTWLHSFARISALKKKKKTVSPNMPKHLAYDVHKPHRTQRAYQFISHLMAYFKL